MGQAVQIVNVGRAVANHVVFSKHRCLFKPWTESMCASHIGYVVHRILHIDQLAILALEDIASSRLSGDTRNEQEHTLQRG
jgi:hypothetical protein